MLVLYGRPHAKLSTLSLRVQQPGLFCWALERPLLKTFLRVPWSDQRPNRLIDGRNDRAPTTKAAVRLRPTCPAPAVAAEGRHLLDSKQHPLSMLTGFSWQLFLMGTRDSYTGSRRCGASTVYSSFG